MAARMAAILKNRLSQIATELLGQFCSKLLSISRMDFKIFGENLKKIT